MDDSHKVQTSSYSLIKSDYRESDADDLSDDVSKDNSKLSARNIHQNNINYILGSSQLIREGTPHHNEAHIDDIELHTGQSPIKAVIFNMLNSIIGAGIVGLPYVYMKSGVIAGVSLMIMFAFLSGYTLRLLMTSAKVVRQNNYEDLCECLFGLPGYWIVSIAMLLFDFGAITSYFIILGDAVSSIISIWGYDSLRDRQLVVLCFGIFIILPAILPRDISRIEKLSAFSVGTVVLINVVVFYEWFEYRLLLNRKSDGYDHVWPDNITYFNADGLSEAVGIIAFAFVCHDMSFLFYKTLKNPTIKRWSVLSFSGTFISVLICIVFSIPGYLTFGNDVSDNILNNYKEKELVIVISRAIYTITMCLTYPPSFFVVRHVLYAIFHHGPHYTSIQECSLKKHLLFTLPLFFFNLALGVMITDLGIVMSLSGSLAAVILAFVLPCCCYLKTCEYNLKFWKERGMENKWNAFKHIAPVFTVLVMGILIAIFSTAYTIYTRIK